jgi:ABC-type transport system substrate-binding protein
MAKSKYPNGYTISDPLECAEFGTQECEVMKAALGKIGIKITVDISLDKYIANFYDPKSHALQWGYIGCAGPDPSGCIDYTLSKNVSNGNTAVYTPPSMLALVQQAAATLNKAKRFQLYTTILQKLATDVPYVAYELPIYTVSLSNKFKWPGIKTLDGNAIFSTPWILDIQPAS